MTQLKQGARFRCKVKGELATGTIQPMDNPKEHWYLLKPTGGRWYIGDGSLKSLLYYQVTDLELLPDEDEPQKGDLVSVSDDEKEWTEASGYFTGGQKRNGEFIVECADSSLLNVKHIRKAPNPDQLKRQEAERKAREFCKSNDYNHVPTIVDALTEYILKTEK